MDTHRDPSRRALVRGALVVGAGAVLAACGGERETARAEREEEEEVSPAEDLMREHGVLKRVLLVYDEAARRLDGKGDVPADALKDAATLVQTFVEGYHERLEEDHLFPRFRKANLLTGLVDVLAAQHEAGRRLTRTTLSLATADALREEGSRARLAGTLRAFVRMYAPHEAREDTVLFPALRKVVSAHEYDALGEDFEKKEHELFGEEGFEKSVERVATIEKAFGIDDLASFTPKE